MRPKICFCLFMIVLCLGLQSCAGVREAVNPYDEQFHCRARDTEGKCVDTPEAYKDARQPQPVGAGSEAASMASARQEAKAGQYKAISELLEKPETPLLKPSKILRVLILPYRGEKNELFMTRYAYLEVEKPSWVLTDIKEK